MMDPLERAAKAKDQFTHDVDALMASGGFKNAIHMIADTAYRPIGEGILKKEKVGKRDEALREVSFTGGKKIVSKGAGITAGGVSIVAKGLAKLWEWSGKKTDTR
jgi:hypothetical protein